MAKLLVKIVAMGMQVVGRAFIKALQQEIAASKSAANRAGGGVRGVEHSATNLKVGMSLDEAQQILNIEELLPEKIQRNFEYLYAINERAKGGSFYLQSKMFPSGHLQFRAGAAQSGMCYGSRSLGSIETRRFSTAVWDNVYSEENITRFRNNVPSLVTPRLPIGYKPKCAVLVPFCFVNGEPALLYTVRSFRLTSHRGEVCFPGGVSDDKDDSLVTTALRETKEEIGLASNGISVWCAMNPILNRLGDSYITPMASFIGEMSEQRLKISESEVDSVFAVTLKSLCNPMSTKYTVYRSILHKEGYTLPLFDGTHPRIWGMTAVITHLALTLLLPGVYNHKVQHIKTLVIRAKERIDLECEALGIEIKTSESDANNNTDKSSTDKQS